MTEIKNEAFDYLRVAWKRKWLIIIPTLFCMIAVGVLSFFLPVKWEVDCIVKPGQFVFQTDSNVYREFNLADAKQIATIINHDTYNQTIAEQLQLDISKFPKITAASPKTIDLIHIQLKDADPERGKSILYLMFDLLREDFNQNVNAEKKEMDIETSNKKILISRYELDIKNKGNDITKTKNEIKQRKIDIKANESLKQKKELEIQSHSRVLKISEEREENILSEMKGVRQRIEKIEEQQLSAKAEEKNNALILLLNSNKMQENLRFYNDLDKELNEEKKNQENLRMLILEEEEQIRSLDIKNELIQTMIANLNLKIKSIENDIGKIKSEIEEMQNSISFLNEKKDTQIQSAKLIKKPTASVYPVSPKKTLNVIVAAFLSFVLFTLLAFILEYYVGTSPKKEDG
jgi:capsular polysaccharide biosynthesis protein